MTDARFTTLPIAPRDFGFLVFVLGLILLTGLVFLLLQGLRAGARRTGWKARLETEGWKAALNALGLVLALAWIALFLLAIWAAFFGTYQLLMPRPSGTSAPAPGLGALGIGTLLGALLGGPFLVWGTWLKHRTVGFQKEGHLTDRISKAVEQLGAEKTVKKDGKETTEPNIEVRIGGILSLERIAQDSTEYDKGRDHVRVMEILCAYIRQNAPASEAKDHGFGEWEALKDGANEAERAAHEMKQLERFRVVGEEGEVRTWAQSLPEPRADVALALRVIGRRSKEQRQAEARWGQDAAVDAKWVFDEECPALRLAAGKVPTTEALEVYRTGLGSWRNRAMGYRGYRLDLRNTNLQGADLSELCLSGALLSETRMEGAKLDRARMEGAYLDLARLEGARLWRAKMLGAHLYRARMEGAVLEEALMDGALLSDAQMQGTNLVGAEVTVANLDRVVLESANLQRARMDGADLGSTFLKGAKFRKARLVGAVLTGARLDETTTLHDAVLDGADLCSVDATRLHITPAQLESCVGDGSTLLSEEAKAHRPSHWPRGGFGPDDLD